MDRSRVSDTVFIALSVAVSVSLAYMAGGIFLFTLPMLVLGRKISSTRSYLLIQGITYLGVAAVVLLPYASVKDASQMGIVAFSALIPLIMSCGTLIYTGMRDKSNSVLRKLVASSIPAFILGTAFAVWLSSPAGKVPYDGFKNAVNSILNSNLLLGENFAQLSGFIVPLMLIVAVPTSMVFEAIPILASEFARNSSNEEWQFNIANMKMPKKYVWALFAGLLVIAFSNFTDVIPVPVSVAGWNVTIGLLLHFAVNGFSILVAYFRRRNAYIPASRVFLLVVILGFIPGLGFAELTGLAVLGILENWIKLR